MRSRTESRLVLPASHDVYAGLFELTATDALSQSLDPCRTHATSHFLMSESRWPTLRMVRAFAKGGAADLVVFALRLQRSGLLTGRMGDRAVECGAGDLLFVDLRQTLDLTLTAGAEGAADLTLWLPQTKLLTAIRDDAALHGFVVPAASPAGAVLGGALKILAEQAPKISAEDMDALCDGILALAARALAPQLARLGGGAQPGASFVTIRRHIDQHLHQPSLNADFLAKRFGLSRASLYRLFEPVGGVALYIRKARLARAYQEIVARDDSGHRIGPIAYSLGFKNLSAFNRLFKAHYGVTPGEAREGSGRAAPPPALPADEQATLAYWLRRLGAPQATAAKRPAP